MFVEATFFREPFRAEFTAEWLLTGMYKQMLFQMVPLYEAFPAKIAAIRPLAGVDSIMDQQSRWRFK